MKIVFMGTPEFAVPSLEILGKKMGAEDFRKYPAANPVVLLEQYTGEDGWFGKFKSSYLKVWNRWYEVKKMKRG